MENPELKTVCFLAMPEELVVLNFLACRVGRTRSSVVREIVATFLGMLAHEPELLTSWDAHFAEISCVKQ